MPSIKTTNILTYGLLAGAAGLAVLLPADLGPRRGAAAPLGSDIDETLVVHTVVRDFQKGHADFTGSISGGNGHYAGNVMPELDADGHPSFVGLMSTPVTDFVIVNGATVPAVNYTPMITVVGSNMDTGTYLMPVTVKVHVGSDAFEPFGNFGSPLAGNVDTKTGNPRSYVYPSVVDAKTPVYITGCSWIKTSKYAKGTVDSDFKKHMTAASSPSTAQVKVLRDGDAVPAMAGFGNQASAATYLQNYINFSTNKITLQKNQTIYLFELYTTDMKASTADFQDLVVVVTLGENKSYLNTLDATGAPPAMTTTPKGYKVQSEWRDSQGHAIPPHLFGTAAGDVAGSKGSASTGGISSGSSFSEWYTDVMGVNMSTQVPLTLKKNDGVWEYKTDDFHPIDGQLFGNEGKQHNHYFTMNFGMDFTHHAGEHRFIEFQGDDDVWVFIDGKLVMDLGGISPGVKQYLDVDRLSGLTDGGKHHIEFFYAQRQENTAAFYLRTNLDLGQSANSTYTISGVGD